MNALGIGSTLCDGRYRLDAVLGRGGMAIVWAATDLQLERRVAIKLISDVLASDPRFVARFEREARLAAGLNHPNLVKLFDFSSEGERPFLVMELVPGGTLAQHSGEGLDATAVARDLLDALAHIHGTGILHRDVKPANVLIGADGRPLLTDFGIARSEDQTGLTMTGQVMGTLRYIAPEVAEGGPATPGSDLYSLGILLGELAGPHPDPRLAGLLERLRDPDPKRRPASALDALTELEPTGPTAALDGTGATLPLDPATPLPAQARREPRVRRHRWPAVSSALAVRLAIGVTAVAMVAVIFATSGGHEQRAAPPAPAPAGAPLGKQLAQLEKIVGSAPKR